MGTIVSKQRPTFKVTTFADGKEVTAEQHRGLVLEKRLKLLNDYIISENAGIDGSFQDFLRSKGITKEMFINGLPEAFQSPPVSGIDDIIDYTERMNFCYIKQYLAYNKVKTEPEYKIVKFLCDADGNEALVEGALVHPETETEMSASGKIKDKWKKIKASVKKVKDSIIKNKQDKPVIHAANKFNPLFVLARNAYSSLLRLNMFGMASTLDKMRMDSDKKEWNEVTTRWYNMGGTKDVFNKGVDVGKSKPPKLRRKGKNADGGYSATGAEEAAAILLAAAPVVVALVPLITSFKKRKGMPVDEETNEMNDALVDPDDSSRDEEKEKELEAGEMSTKMKWIIGGSIAGALVLTTIIVLVVKSGKNK